MDAISKAYNKMTWQFRGYQIQFLFNVWGEGSLAKTEGSLAATVIINNYIYYGVRGVFAQYKSVYKLGERLWVGVGGLYPPTPKGS